MWFLTSAKWIDFYISLLIVIITVLGFDEGDIFSKMLAYWYFYDDRRPHPRLSPYVFAMDVLQFHLHMLP